MPQETSLPDERVNLAAGGEISEGSRSGNLDRCKMLQDATYDAPPSSICPLGSAASSAQGGGARLAAETSATTPTSFSAAHPFRIVVTNLPRVVESVRQAAASEPAIEVVFVGEGTATTMDDELPRADLVVPTLEPFPAARLDRALCPRLRALHQFGVGLEMIDLEAARASGVWVSNIPSANSGNAVGVAEVAVFLLLSSLRRANDLRADVLGGVSGGRLGETIAGKRILLVGFGGIAREVVPRLGCWGCEIDCVRAGEWAEDAADDPVAAALASRGVWERDATRLASRADVVLVTATYGRRTHGLIDGAFLASCRPGVHLVNVSRGGILDRPAIEEALASGHLASLAADVWWNEPADPSDPLLHDSRVTVTPHVGGITVDSYRSMADTIVSAAKTIMAGGRLARIVN